MQHGDEDLPDFPEFLTRWITYLGAIKSGDADRLILEANGLLNDFSAAVRYAEEYAVSHPGLYLNILENETCTEEEITAFCSGLPRYKRPRKIIFDKVPRNPTGKIEKPVLRERYCHGSLVEAQIKN